MSRFSRSDLFCRSCTDNHEKEGVFLRTIDVRYFRVLFGPASADMNLSISKRTQDERNDAYIYADFENGIIFSVNVLQNGYNPLTIIQ